MEPGSSLLCSQEPSTGPYPEPDDYNTYHLIVFLKDNISLPPTSGLPSGPFPSGYPTKILSNHK
jgi:hypothetical protein